MSIEDALNIEKVEEKKELTIQTSSNTNFELAERRAIDLAQKAESLLDEVIEVAKQLETPQAYQAAATVLKANIDANANLVKIAELKGETASNNPKTVTNNNVFVGSTTDILDMIKKLRNTKEEEDIIDITPNE